MEQIEIFVPLDDVGNAEAIREAVALAVGAGNFGAVHVASRSLDARRGKLRFRLLVDVAAAGETLKGLNLSFPFQDVALARPVAIVGAGPAGLFAALRCLELGLKPIVLERGRDVQGRRRDLAAITKAGIVNPESNYCFGEGGAGTYSDGKLYTRSTKRGDVGKVLRLLIAHGAPPDIAVDAHPHVGTNKLPGIISAMRETILAHGGEVRFGSKVVGVQQNALGPCLHLADGTVLEAGAVILATGHSANDVYAMLHEAGVLLEAKPFALGVRIEHPQAIIDEMQYHLPMRHPALSPATYSLVAQHEGTGVFSFCMCPGGVIAPCATNPGEIVTNGWSPSKRNNPYANSGLVAEIKPAHWAKYGAHNPLAGLAYRGAVERACFTAGGGTLAAPAQRAADFVAGRLSPTLPGSSYHPGLASVGLREVLPPHVYQALRAGLKAFDKKMKGYLTNEAVLVATESRTSAPVRIPRGKDTLMHPQVAGLFPCGEGAGFAGGIVSAAIDGERCADAAAAWLKSKGL